MKGNINKQRWTKDEQRFTSEEASIIIQFMTNQVVEEQLLIKIVLTSPDVRGINGMILPKWKNKHDNNNNNNCNDI